ncbi:hypothetical protein PAXRUDRAFT_224301 [Paxillus rubicundulus Ve08.2h10]|uniref:Unplaced genomic scaffold scaffold_114, whole genome shotgun sequence n=1 Tax=Paxillus rubicundulus Ve08.2h10 TaxID=930991 RepID=A0A0D0E768_9AGAM|nr:hypothetical protein PAXRUDRAFT_224301 [Paxillus rubicundulus Ve08.2h10]
MAAYGLSDLAPPLVHSQFTFSAALRSGLQPLAYIDRIHKIGHFRIKLMEIPGPYLWSPLPRFVKDIRIASVTIMYALAQWTTILHVAHQVVAH